MIAKFPASIQDFANTFVSMQDKRHDADYNPNKKFAKSAVIQDVATVKQSIADFNAVPVKDRKAFCVFVLFKKRPAAA